MDFLFSFFFSIQIPVKDELDMGLDETMQVSELPVPVSSIKEEDDKIDVTTVHELPIRVYSVS